MKTVKNNTMKIGGGTLIYPDDLDLEQELYENYRDLLLTGSCRNTTWLAKMLEKDFKALATKETDDALKVVKEVGKIAQATSNYFNKKKEGDVDYALYLIDRTLFDWQRKVAESKDRNIQLICGRRTGKSYGLAAIAVRHCVKGYDLINGIKKPRSVMMVGLTASRAADIFWDNVLKYADESKLPVKHTDNGAHTIEFSNGASIAIGGVGNKAEIQKIRGADYSLMIIDEGQSIKGLMTLIKDVCEPIQTGRDSTIILAGTGPLYAGSFYEQVCESNQWTHFKYTMNDNPSVPTGALEEVLRKNGWDENNPTFQREYLANTVFDENLLMIPTVEYFELSEIDRSYNKAMLTLDYGFTDKTAVGLILYNDNNDMRLVWEWAEPKQPVSRIIEKVKEAMEIAKTKYNIDVNNIKCVADNSDQSISREIYLQGVTCIQNAYKVDLLYQINRLNEMCYTGKLKVLKGGVFDEEHYKTVWKRNEENGKIIYEEDKDVFHPDQIHSVRYGVNTILTDNPIC